MTKYASRSIDQCCHFVPLYWIISLCQTPSKKSIAGKRAASLKPPRSASAALKNRGAKKTYARLNDSKIKLQALAWSADTSKRMAVINGRILREGESMDGYQINQIRPEDVVVSDGRQLWSLEFGLQQ